MASWHITCCMYCNTDVVITKPVTGRASICSASLRTTRKLIALGFHTEKGVSQHSHSRDPVPVHIIHAIHCNILPYAIYRYVEVSVLHNIIDIKTVLLHIVRWFQRWCILQM